MIALRNLRAQISDRCCATRQLSKISYPPNGHIIEGHLCLIMSGCSPTINSCPLQPLAGWLLQEKLTLVIESIPSSEDCEGLEVTCEDLPRVIGRGLCDLSSRRIR